MIHFKNEKEISRIRESCILAAKVLDEAVKFARSGVSTNEINDLVHKLTIDAGAIPSPLNYKGFPKSVCTSVNHVVTHGIPNDYRLQSGDIINIDVTCNLNGYHGDCSRMVLIGKVSPEIEELVKTTEKALLRAIHTLKIGNPLSDIGSVIHDLADEKGYGVVREYCGHGIGRNFHEDPLILHYRTNKPHPKIRPGMVFTIEPMINLGKPQTRVLSDGWTVVTVDGQVSAQFEHTLAILPQGVEILTQVPGDSKSLIGYSD